MYKHKKINIAVGLIIISLIANALLFCNFNKVNKELQMRKIYMLSNSETAIDNAANHIGQLISEWENINEVKKMKYMGDAKEELTVALELMSVSDNFFAPIKIYRGAILHIENRILNQINIDTQKDYLLDLKNDLSVLSVFLSNNRISQMTNEQLIKQWKRILPDLKNKGIYEYSNQLAIPKEESI